MAASLQNTDCNYIFLLLTEVLLTSGNYRVSKKKQKQNAAKEMVHPLNHQQPALLLLVVSARL